jgi:hypothetical protein
LIENLIRNKTIYNLWENNGEITGYNQWRSQKKVLGGAQPLKNILEGAEPPKKRS